MRMVIGLSFESVITIANDTITLNNFTDSKNNTCLLVCTKELRTDANNG